MSVGEVPVGVVVDHLDVLARNDQGVVVILVVNHNVPVGIGASVHPVTHNYINVDLPILTSTDLVSMLGVALLSQRHFHISLTFNLVTVLSDRNVKIIFIVNSCNINIIIIIDTVIYRTRSQLYG